MYFKGGNIKKSKWWNINEKKRYHTVLPIQKSDRKIVVRDKLDYPNTYIHSSSLSWLGIGTGTINSGEVELVV